MADPHEAAARSRARATAWRWALAIVLLAAALRSEALWVGFAMDDWAQLAMLANAYGVERAPWDLFSFCDGSPREVGLMVESGLFPWWTDQELKLSTLRPLASVLVWLDVEAFGIDARWHRVHTFVWWIAMLVVVARLLLRVLPMRWALLAFALYALDECHAQPLAWSANRNAILATLFGIAAVHAHVRWREDGAASWHAWVLLVLAFASGEVALAAFGFIGAYEVTRRDRPMRALAGYIVVVVAWAIVHRVLGYGAAYSGVYVDPSEVSSWIVAALDRGPILLADLAFALPTGQLALGGRGMLVQRVLGVFAFAAAAWWLRGRDGRSRWFALAAVLAVIPMVSAFVSARLLVLPAIAGHVLVAAFILEAIDARALRGVVSKLRLVVATALGIAHLGLAPWWSVREIADLREFGAAAQEAADTAPPEIGRELVIVPVVADPSTLLYPPLVRAALGSSVPGRWAVLSAAPGPHRLRRIDARTLELHALGGLLRTPVEQMFRRRGRPFYRDPIQAWNGAVIEVLDYGTQDFPSRVRFTFAQSLDDPNVVVMLATPRGFVRYPLGPIGSEIAVPPASAPLAAD